MTPEEEAFWPTYSWAENSWVVDMQRNVLTSTRYSQFQLCPIAKLHLQRIGCRTYSFVLQTAGTVTYQQAKLRKWSLAILHSVPNLEVGQELHVRTDLRLRHTPQLKQTYIWEHTMTGRIRGVVVNSDQGQQGAIDLEQDSDGIQWSIAANNIGDQQTAADRHRH